MHSIQILDRIVEWTVDDTTWEADLRRAEIIRKSFDVTGRSVSTLRVTDKIIDIEESFRLRSISPVTDLICRSSALIWHARCNIGFVRGWYGCSSGACYTNLIHLKVAT